MPWRHSQSINRKRHIRHRGPVSGAALPRERLKVGMAVIVSAGERLGVVKAVRDADFLVGRAAQPEIDLPFQAIQDITRNSVVLRPTAK